MPATAPDFKPGQTLPGTKYTIVKQLGAGGMGVVYLVKKPPEIQGVLKLMSTDLASHDEFRRRFLDEVRILAQLDHPNIVRVFDYDSLADGTPFYVMEVLTGRTVRDVLATMGRLPPRVAYEITRQLLEALHCAHTHDVTVVHRDIKPENIFLHAPRHGEPLVKLIDFGVIAVADRTHDGMFVGTWKYAAPEQIRGEKATAATDLYAVGLVLYEMLTGVSPFERYDSGSAVAEAHMVEMPSPVSRLAPWVPPSIVSLIQSALAKHPRQRPRDAYAFAERLYDLEWAVSGPDGALTVAGPVPEGERPISHVLSSVSIAREDSARSGAPWRAGAEALPPRHEPTLPNDDALLEGLEAPRDAKPRSRRERESDPSEGEPSPAPPRVPSPHGGVPVAGPFEALPPTLSEVPNVAATGLGARELQKHLDGLPRVDNDTFASQESDARPPRRKNRFVLPAAAGLIAVSAAISVAALRSRGVADVRARNLAETPEPPKVETSTSTPPATAQPPTLTAGSAAVPQPPSTPTESPDAGAAHRDGRGSPSGHAQPGRAPTHPPTATPGAPAKPTPVPARTGAPDGFAKADTSMDSKPAPTPAPTPKGPGGAATAIGTAHPAGGNTQRTDYDRSGP